MKTTNYEISKKLKEAGFEDSYIYAWYSDSEGLPWIQEIQHAKPTAVNKYREKVKLTFTAPAYDLETILDALPSKITTKFKGDEIEETFRIYKGEIRYSVSADEVEYYIENYDYYMKFGFCVKDWEGETYADAAGRLLIKLHEAGIVNFKK